MDVITLSSDSNSTPPHKNVEVDIGILSPPNVLTWDDDIYNVDWNDDARPPIDYNSQTVDTTIEKQSNKEILIEDFVTPAKPNLNDNAKVSNPTDEEETISYICQINDLSYAQTMKNNSSPPPTLKKASPPRSQALLEVLQSKTKSKLSQKEKQTAKLLKEQKKLERERMKEVKKLEQQRQKAYKLALLENQRNLKPEENIKFLKVHIDNEIINATFGGNIISILQQNNIQYVVEAQPKSFTITWSKRIVEKVVNELGELSDKVENREEAQLLYVLGWKTAVHLVHTNELQSHVETVKSNYIDKSLTLIIFGLGKYFDYKKTKRDREMKSGTKKVKLKEHEKIYEDAPSITRDQLEFALIDLQLLGKYNSRLLETPEELSALVMHFTKSLSQLDFKFDKQKRQDDELGWFAKGESGQCAKVDKNGIGLLNLWQQQIFQFNAVSLETAQAVVSRYTSPAALVNDYKTCETEKQGQLLLQDLQIRRNAGILSCTRRVGPQLSKKIYNFFTSENPDLEL